MDNLLTVTTNPLELAPFQRGRRETVVVNGRFALSTERLKAARAGATGLQVIAVEHLAERLAGGFLRMVSLLELKKALAKALPAAKLGELDAIKDLPGLVHAGATTLMKYWLSGADLESLTTSRRVQSILALEDAALSALPANMKRPRDLIDIAMSRAHLSKALFGDIVFRGMTELHPVWRRLLIRMGKETRIVWESGPRPQRPGWIGDAATILHAEAEAPETASVSCATPRHEAIEAMRWARELVAEKGVAPGDIAIATVSASTYSDHFLALKGESDLPLHMAMGVAATQTKPGQEAAALADLLLRGLSQKRVLRFVKVRGVEDGPFAGLPEGWERSLRPDATLRTERLWERTLARKTALAAVSAIIMPFVRDVAAFTQAGKEEGKQELAAELGARLLSEGTAELWKLALVNGPWRALDRTLEAMPARDGTDPHSSVCFMSAETLAASPRPYVRLVGLTSRSWPRKFSEDALIPSSLIARSVLDPLPAAEADRRDFWTILDTTPRLVVLSWPRRGDDGRNVKASGLVGELDRKRGTQLRNGAESLRRMRTARHAMSESDRLLARPSEFAATPQAVSAAACWADWKSKEVTAHDGLLSGAHPRIQAVLRRRQSSTSLRNLLRDPISFVWKYALGFEAPESDDDKLFLDSRRYGNIVHDILQRSVRETASLGGFSTLDETRLRAIVGSVAGEVGTFYELSNPVPPNLIWRSTISRAIEEASATLLDGLPPLPGQKSWVEVPFGGGQDWYPDGLPWDPNEDVTVPGTDIRVMGRIDRLDLSGARDLARVIDYKTGRLPDDSSMVLDGGRELQRCIYGFAVRSLIPGASVESGLLYSRELKFLTLQEFDRTLEVAAEAISEAVESIERGVAVPGMGSEEGEGDLLFAMPANSKGDYMAKKSVAFRELLGDAATIWSVE